MYEPDSKEIHWNKKKYEETLKGLSRQAIHRRMKDYQIKVDEETSKRIGACNKAETHLNTCAVLSQLKRHDLALQHAN